MRFLLPIAVALLTSASAVASGAPSQASTSRGPETAPVTMVLYSDFACPFCASVAPVLDALQRLYPHHVRLVFKHMPLAIHADAPLAHEAALAAAAQGKFWEMHDRLFAQRSQQRPEDLEEHAQALGLEMDRFRRELRDRRYRPIVVRDVEEAEALGVTATPTLFVNGRRLIGAQSLEALRGVVAEALGETTPAPLPVVLDNASAPVRGDVNAPVTITLFSDFLCPFCARANQTLDEVRQIYDHRVKLVFRHLPLDIHPGAQAVHRIALAAGAQGRFWEMHDALFADPRRFVTGDGRSLASGLGLDLKRFESDLADEGQGAALRRDLAEAQRLNLDSTPVFFINGHRFDGARPLADFTAAVDRALFDAGVPRPMPSPTLGPAEAPVTIIWFGDLQSALNAEASALVQRIVREYAGMVRVVYREAPASPGRGSSTAYEAALAAGAQGRFWDMHDLLMANRGINSATNLSALAQRLLLDRKAFDLDFRGRTFRPRVDADLTEARRQDVRGTPTFFVNGERVDGLIAIDEFKRVVRRHLQ